MWNCENTVKHSVKIVWGKTKVNILFEKYKEVKKKMKSLFCVVKLNYQTLSQCWLKTREAFGEYSLELWSNNQGPITPLIEVLLLWKENLWANINAMNSNTKVFFLAVAIFSSISGTCICISYAIFKSILSIYLYSSVVLALDVCVCVSVCVCVFVCVCVCLFF